MTTFTVELPPELAATLQAMHERLDGIEKALTEDTPPLSVKEAASAMGITPPTVRKMIHEGKIEAHLVAGNYKIRREDLPMKEGK